MDFIIGIIFCVIIILILYNYVTISVSNTNVGNVIKQCSAKPNNYTSNNTSNNTSNYIPNGILSKDVSAVNGKFSLHDQTDDYHRQFYLAPY